MKKKKTKRAGKEAGRVNYSSAKHRYYPKWMWSTEQGVSAPAIGIWHMRRFILWRLGFADIDGRRNDIHTTFTPDQIARYYELLDWADKKLKQYEDQYYEMIKDQERKLKAGILADVFKQTEEIAENNKFKQCLNYQLKLGEIEMARKSFDEIMDWAKNQRDYESAFNYLKFPQGIHLVRVLSGVDEDYYRAYTQHDCGTEKEFRCWLCWDYIMDNADVREYYAEKELLTEADAKKAKKYGDPVCTTLDVIKKYVRDMEPIYKALRTKTRVVMNMFYVCQIYPKDATEKTPKPGLYILEQSAAFNKLIIGAMQKESLVETEDALELVSIENGKPISIQVEGEGIGKNKRTYTVDFKGKSGPVIYNEEGTNPYQKGAERLTLPDDFQIYNLQDAEAMRFLPYQEVINRIKEIKTIYEVIKKIGYDIPGDEPSDNPLDDNYDKDFAKRTVGKPIKKQLNEDSPIMKTIKPKTEDWEDEEVLKKERKQVQSKKVVEVDDDEEEEDTPPTKRNKAKVNGKTLSIEIEEEEEEEEDIFEKAVPKSDPKKEVITNAPKKRKIF